MPTKTQPTLSTRVAAAAAATAAAGAAYDAAYDAADAAYADYRDAKAHEVLVRDEAERDYRMLLWKEIDDAIEASIQLDCPVPLSPEDDEDYEVFRARLTKLASGSVEGEELGELEFWEADPEDGAEVWRVCLQRADE